MVLSIITSISIFSLLLTLPLLWEGALLQAAKRLGVRVVYTLLPPGIWGSFDSPEYSPEGESDPNLILISYHLPVCFRFIPLLNLLIRYLHPQCGGVEVFLASILFLFPVFLIFPLLPLLPVGRVALRIWRAIISPPLGKTL
jgi:hypothetical protein